MPAALVIGAGFGGLAAALRLRARGYDVTVIDRMPMLGGRAQVFRRGGFVFDAGPTVITAPFLIEELFALFSRDYRDYLEFKPLDPWYRIRFPDGRQFNYGGSVTDTLTEIARFNPADCDGYLRLVQQSRRIFDIGFSQLAHQPFHRFTAILKQLPRLLALQSYRSVYGLVARYIQDPCLRQAFSLQPLLVGGNPFDTTSIYVLIHYLERRWGVHFTMGGTGALVAALGRLMEEVGITIRLNQSVTEILVENGRARGVRLENGQRLRADLVVVNGDPPFVYQRLIAARHRRQWTDRRLARLKYSMGLFVLYFGTTRRYEEVAHHTIWLGRTYKALLQDIFHRQVLSDDFSLYLHRPTATDASLAPAGCDSFYVLSPVPNLQSGIDWEAVGPGYRDRIVEALERTLLPGLRNHIIHDFYVTPVNFQNGYLSQWGSGFSIAPLFSQSAFFRFHNRAGDIDRLYFVGAGTHPGAGVPGVLSSAKVLDSLLPTAEQWSTKNHGQSGWREHVGVSG
jgi:phytoene desaturase